MRVKKQAVEIKCYQKLLNISYKGHDTYNDVCRKIQAAIGEYNGLLTMVKLRTFCEVNIEGLEQS